MKKIGKQVICAVMTLSVLAGISASAVSENVKVKIFTRPVYVEGREVYVEDANGKDMEFLTYNGTTYIPLRMAGNWMGKNVVWDGTTRTVTLYGTTAKTYRTRSTEIQDKAEWKQGTTGNGLPATIEPDVKIIVDGRTQTFKNPNGQTIYPLSYKNTLYLPVRNIGELSGMTVVYRPANQSTGEHETIFMRTAMTDAQISAGETYVQTLFQLNSYAACKAQGKDTASLAKEFQARDGEEDDVFTLMTGTKNPSLDELRQFAEIGLAAMNTMLDTPMPDCPVLEYKHAELMEEAAAAKEACEKVIAAINAGESRDVCHSLMLSASVGSSNPNAAHLCKQTVSTINEMNFVVTERNILR